MGCRTFYPLEFLISKNGSCKIVEVQSTIAMKITFSFTMKSTLLN